MGGPRALATAAFYLVLKSNGYNHQENRLKKFEVSLKITSTNLAKKLPSQTLSQTVSHRDFQLLSQTAHVRFYRRKRVHHSPFGERWHTAAHTPKHGVLFLSLLGAFCSPHTWAKESRRKRMHAMACVRFLRRRSPAGLRNFGCK